MPPMPDASQAPLFFALPAPAAVQALAGRVQEAVRSGPGAASFPPLEGLHVTLAFLGRVDPGTAGALVELARAAARGLPGFPLATGAWGGFPRFGQARVLWLGFERQPVLVQLAAGLAQILQAGGIPLDPRPFTPHLTLARFRAPVDLGGLSLPPPEPVAFAVSRFGLYQSAGTPLGPRYQELGSVPLPVP